MHRNPSTFRHRTRGIAMMLVLFAVVIATVLSMSFLSAQTATSGMNENIQHHARARFIAESAMQMVTAHILRNDDWRSQFSHGTWISDQPLAGGTFTVTGEDGVDGDSDGDLNDDPLDPVTITVVGSHAGRTHVVRTVITVATQAAQAGPSSHGASVTGTITLTGSARIDAVDSSTSTYNPGNDSNTKASIATNTTANAKVTLTGSAVAHADVYIGAGGNPASVISAYNHGTPITGTRLPLNGPVAIPAITLLNDLPNSRGNVSLSGSRTTNFATGTYRYNNLTVTGSHTVNITGNVIIHCDGDFTITGSGEVRFNNGATLTLYTNKVQITGSGEINTNLSPPLPSRLKIFQTGSNDASISGSGDAYACILAPDAKLVVSGSGRFFGSFQGDALEITGSGRFTQDLALTQGGGIEAAGGATSYLLSTRWVEAQ